MRTNGRIGSDGRGFARIGAVSRPLSAVTPSGSRGAIGRGGVIDSHAVPHPRVNPGHCSGLLHLRPMVAPHMPPAPDPHNGLCITIPLATGGTGFREAPRSVRRSERPIPVRTANKALNNATPERTHRRNQALVCGRVLWKHRPCVRNWGRGDILRWRTVGVPGRGARQGEGATGVGRPRPGLRVCGVERGGGTSCVGGSEDRRARARTLQRNAPELRWRSSSARRR